MSSASDGVTCAVNLHLQMFYIAHRIIFHVWDHDQFIGGFCHRKLTRRDRLSNEVPMAIATGLFVLLALWFIDFVFGIKINSLVAFAAVN